MANFWARRIGLKDTPQPQRQVRLGRLRAIATSQNSSKKAPHAFPGVFRVHPGSLAGAGHTLLCHAFAERNYAPPRFTGPLPYIAERYAADALPHKASPDLCFAGHCDTGRCDAFALRDFTMRCRCLALLGLTMPTLHITEPYCSMPPLCRA